MFETEFGGMEADLRQKFTELVDPAVQRTIDAKTKWDNLKAKMEQYKLHWRSFDDSRSRKVKAIADAAAAGGNAAIERKKLREAETEANELLSIAKDFETKHVPAAENAFRKCQEEERAARHQAIQEVHKVYVRSVRDIMNELFEAENQWEAAVKAVGTECDGKYLVPRPFATKELFQDHYKDSYIDK